ncbi:hypothetical protein J3R82DRAFT_1390 [Butyriboletus roseoflavus]|nr:hypothetical protein J3R82DRAFT_1390 [Butyriboletus roseoflavus]
MSRIQSSDTVPPLPNPLPVQILITGISLTLAAILLLHLIFTAQYHWPLARTNYILQITGVTTLLISIGATIYVIFSTTVQQSQHWPYMLSYLAVEMPSANYTTISTDPTLFYQHRWTPPQSATWVVMNATTSVIVQITHIHFLTLLFPSDLEARLIFGLLGPLAIISAVMQLLPVICGTGVAGIAADTRNVCNAALSLLFTSFLIIWGFFVNRRQAWRTDGGTAAFGAGAIILAFISASLNFVYIPRQDQYAWMPKLMWAVTLWQSFLGWWWWVGAGMGVREIEELLQREKKRQQKRILRAQRQKEHREKAKSVWKGVTDAFKPSTKDRRAIWRRTRARYGALAVSGRVERIDGDGVGIVGVDPPRADGAAVATERAERIQQVYKCDEEWRPDREYRKPVGWGLGSYGLREAQRERREEMEMGERIPREEDEEEWKEEEWKAVSVVQGAVPDGLRHRGTETRAIRQTEESAGSSLWWWGPLRRWRLKDSTTYR